MKRRRLWTSLAVVFLLAVALGAWGWYRVDRWCSPPFPIDADPVVGRQVYSIASDLPEPPKDAPQLDGFPIIGKPVAIPADLARELREVLKSRSTYMYVDSMCFEPGMAVSFGSGADRVDVVICLLCDRAVFYRGGVSSGRRLTDEGKQRLKSIYDRMFPPTSQP
jgi:hypothetical protein